MMAEKITCRKCQYFWEGATSSIPGAVYADEIEEWLDEAAVREFNMEVEDGSLREVRSRKVSGELLEQQA